MLGCVGTPTPIFGDNPVKFESCIVACWLSMSEAEGKSPGAGEKAEAFGCMKLETSYLKIGKDYGYSGEALVSFVERKLTEATDRDQ